VAFIAFNFCLFFVFSGMESTFAVWCDIALGMGPRAVGYYLSFAGLCGAFVQAWLVGRVVARFGETPAVVGGFVAVAAGLVLLPNVAAPPMLLPALALLSIGFGLGNPSLLSLVSREAPSHIRGGAMGLTQSGAALGRVLGPTWAGFAFAAFGSSWPFLSGALILIPVTLAALALARHVRARGAGA
jgi:MFS family permease